MQAIEHTDNGSDQPVATHWGADPTSPRELSGEWEAPGQTAACSTEELMEVLRSFGSDERTDYRRRCSAGDSSMASPPSPQSPAACFESFEGKRSRSLGDSKEMGAPPTTELTILEGFLEQRHRDSAQSHLLNLASVYSVVSSLTGEQQAPFLSDLPLHLGADREERLKLLLARKPRVLREARRYARERTVFMDLGNPVREKSEFVTPSGDFCALHFEVMPVEGNSSAQQVFNAFQSLLVHTQPESESLVDLPVCGQPDGLDASDDMQHISQHRVVRSAAQHGAPEVESNEVLYSHFSEKGEVFGGGRAHGVLAIESVDWDELLPYSPDRRLRLDTTSVITVQTASRDTPGEQNFRAVARTQVVLTCSVFFKLHRSSMLEVSTTDMQKTLEQLSRRGVELFDEVQAAVLANDE